MVGHMLVDCRRVMIHAARLARREIANRRGKPRVDDEMRRAHQRRHEPAGHFVLTLGAGLEALQVLLDAVFDSLVVTGLEMQTVVIAAGAPVAAEQSLVADEKYRHRDRLGTDSRPFEAQPGVRRGGPAL